MSERTFEAVQLSLSNRTLEAPFEPPFSASVMSTTRPFLSEIVRAEGAELLLSHNWIVGLSAKVHDRVTAPVRRVKCADERSTPTACCSVAPEHNGGFGSPESPSALMSVRKYNSDLLPGRGVYNSAKAENRTSCPRSVCLRPVGEKSTKYFWGVHVKVVA
jgi:hypothetical protein